MNSYLKIAEKILNKSKKPLTAKEILEAAYRVQLVPPHLFGKTQHKTLQARLSEDVLYNKLKTIFARTAPGRFTLRANAVGSGKIESKYVAPLRSYQLKKFEVVCARRNEFEAKLSEKRQAICFQEVAELFQYRMPLLAVEKDDSFVHMQIFVVIRCRDLILSLTGDAESSLSKQRALGLFGFLKESDADLFSSDSFGFDYAARRIISEQTNMPRHLVDELVELSDLSSMTLFYVSKSKAERKTIWALTAYECLDPDIVTTNVPTSRLARWTKALSGINDIDSLEEISKQIISDASLKEVLIC